MMQKKHPVKRYGHLTSLGDLTSKVLDPALKKRGFASRDLMAHWQDMVPHPYA